MSALLNRLRQMEQQVRSNPDLTEQDVAVAMRGIDDLRLAYQEFYPEAARVIDKMLERVESETDSKAFREGLSVGMEASVGLIEGLKQVIGHLPRVQSKEQVANLIGQLFNRYSVFSEALADSLDLNQNGEALEIDTVEVVFGDDR